ncbi:MAG: S9 family peptidase [Gemmatimonadota bacterium]
MTTRSVALWCVLALVASGSGTAQTAGWTAATTLRIKQVGGADVSPDGARVVFQVGTPIVEGERSEVVQQVFLARADGSGAATQLTTGDRSSFAPAWSPDGSAVGFLSARSGRVNLWRMQPDGSGAEQLTDVAGRITLFKWSPDGTQIAFMMVDPETDAEQLARRERRDWRVIGERVQMSRLHVIALAGGGGPRKPRALTPATFNVGFTMIQSIISYTFDWSPDSKTIAFTHSPSPVVNDWSRNDLSLVDVATGSVRPLVATGAAEYAVSYSPDGRWVAYLSSDDPPTWGFTYRVRLVPAGGGPSRALADTYDSKPALIGWLDNDRILVHEPRGTGNRLYVLPAAGGPAIDFSGPGLTPGYPVISRSRRHLAVVLQGTDRPAEVYQSGTGRYEPVQVSRVQSADLPPVPRTEVVAWRSTDGTPVEGLLTYPIGFRPGTAAPLLVGLHGGPTGTITQNYTGQSEIYNVAVFAAQGFAVLRVNFRGSSGYGRAFRYANYRDWGGGDVQDVLTGVDDLVRRGIADPDRLGVMGWSYGGYLTASIITQSNRFKAASVGAGWTDLVSFAATTDMRDFVGDYLGDYGSAPALWHDRSPIFKVGNISAATLIEAGEADIRVPISQGYELYAALTKLGRPVRMVVYPRQGHVVGEPKLQLHVVEDNLEWFTRWLRKTP